MELLKYKFPGCIPDQLFQNLGGGIHAPVPFKAPRLFQCTAKFRTAALKYLIGCIYYSNMGKSFENLNVLYKYFVCILICNSVLINMKYEYKLCFHKTKQNESS